MKKLFEITGAHTALVDLFSYAVSKPGFILWNKPGFI